MGRLEGRIGRFLARWVRAVSRRPLIVILLVLGLTALSLTHTIGHLGIQGDTESLFDRDLRFRQLERRYSEAFPVLYESLFVVVDGPTPERTAEAIEALALRLEADTDHFHSAFIPGGGAFFREHAFLYLPTDELEQLADRLAWAQPYLSELSRDGTLRNFASMLARGIRAVREGDVPPGQLVAIFDGLAEALTAEAEQRPYHLSWGEVLAGHSIGADQRQRFLMVQPVLAREDLQPARAAILRVREAAARLKLDRDGFRVRITGDAALSFEEMETIRTQAALAGVASFFLVGTILFVALRSARLVLSTLLTLLVGLVLTAGFTTLAVGHLNLISVCFAVLFIGLGVDFGIHLCMHYRELLQAEYERTDALAETARRVGSSIFLCALTTAIGFFAFVPTDFLGVAELGLISGAGMFVSLFCTLTLLPALLSLGPAPTPGGRPRPGPVGAIASLPLWRPRAVRAAAVLLGLGAVVLIPNARFDNNPLRVRDPSSESVRALSDLLARGGSSPWSLNAVVPDLEHAEALAERLRGLDVVERVVTVSDFVPRDQEAKLGIIGDVAMFLPSLRGPDHDGPIDPPTTLVALQLVETELGRLAAGGAPPVLAESAVRLQATLSGYLARLRASDRAADSLAAVQRSVMGSLPQQLRLLEEALRAGRVTLQTLPDALVERMVTEDGRVRVQIFPSADLNDHAALATFVDGVREVEPEVAGPAAEILESGRAVVRALRQALLGAVLAVALFLLLLWRSVNDTALVLVPLTLASMLTVAAAVLLDIPFNFADVIVLPLLLGIGVDSGIHLVHRARQSWHREPNILATSTARAVAYSALTTIASFGTMGFATHRGLATLGQLLTLGVGMTILCNLVVLPSLIVLHSRHRARATGASIRRRRWTS